MERQNHIITKLHRQGLLGLQSENPEVDEPAEIYKPIKVALDTERKRYIEKDRKRQVCKYSCVSINQSFRTSREWSKWRCIRTD